MNGISKMNYNEEIRVKLDIPEILGEDGWMEDYEDWFVNLREEVKEKVFDELSAVVVELNAKVQAFMQKDLAVQKGYIHINDDELCYMYEALRDQNCGKISEVLQGFGWSYPW